MSRKTKRDPVKQCVVCGMDFPRYRHQTCCSPECTRKRDKERSREYLARRRERESGSGVPLSPVPCKCPRCGIMHTVSMAPVRPGFVPRVYCEHCGLLVSLTAGYRDVQCVDHHIPWRQ